MKKTCLTTALRTAHTVALTPLVGAIMGLWLTVAQAAPPNPQFLGTWVLDISSMQPPPPVRPKIVVVMIKDAGGGAWVSNVLTEMPDGTRHSRAGIPVRNDGVPTPVIDNPLLDSVKAAFPDARTRVLTGSKGGRPLQTETYKLSADGKRMVLTTTGTTPDGKPIQRTEIFNRH